MPAKIIRGSGLLNRAINALPIELHIPGYQFRGPGTHLETRLARGDRGINPLDAACREHDIAYSRRNDLGQRHVADNILATKARTDYRERFDSWRKSSRYICLGSYESKDKIRYGDENKKIIDEEKNCEKTNISYSKARWYLTNFSIIGSSRFSKNTMNIQ
ncbi:hypothetical protein ACS0PU_000077 [Formica fusca]